MKLSQDTITRSCDESEIYNSLLQLDNKDILELGCGKAAVTRAIACSGKNRRITALEVDERQHAENLKITDLDNVIFRIGGAEAIPVDDNSQDILFMFKSLHHVPEDKLDTAMREIQRVLRPGGRAYISEPLFMGDFNEILRLFNDEQQVRQAAFHTIQRAVADGLFSLEDEIFFNTTVAFRDFADFEDNVLNVTHTHHELDEATFRQVKARFEQHCTENGVQFKAPLRVDLLRTPAC